MKARRVVCEVTPEMAALWLSQHVQVPRNPKRPPHPGYRASHQRRIAAYAEAMAAGRWDYRTSSHACSLRKDGRVWGWHRMHAIVTSQVPVVLEIHDESGRLDGVSCLESER